MLICRQGWYNHNVRNNKGLGRSGLGLFGLTIAKGIYAETIACVASSDDHIDNVICAYVCIKRWFIISILLAFVRGEAKQGRFAAHFFFTVVEGGFQLKIYVWANLYT